MSAGALLAMPWCAPGHAQPRVWRVAYISPGSPDNGQNQRLREGMRDHGYEIGKNLVIEERFAHGQYDRLPAFVAEVLAKKVDVILVAGTPAALAVKQATSTVPVVMTTVGDPVASGLVASLARPGGNFTGLSLANADLPGKWLELARSLAPQGTIIVLADRHQPTAPAYVKNIQSLGQRLGASVSVAYALTPKEIEKAFASLARDRAPATAIILPSGRFQSMAAQIAELALRYGVRSMGTTEVYAERGALVSYGQNYAAYTRQAARYVDRIFKGAKPAELPIEQPMNLQLVVNLSAARKLGVAIPQELMARADRVIQ